MCKSIIILLTSISLGIQNGNCQDFETIEVSELSFRILERSTSEDSSVYKLSIFVSQGNFGTYANTYKLQLSDGSTIHLVNGNHVNGEDLFKLESHNLMRVLSGFDGSRGAYRIDFVTTGREFRRLQEHNIDTIRAHFELAKKDVEYKINGMSNLIWLPN